MVDKLGQSKKSIFYNFSIDIDNGLLRHFAAQTYSSNFVIPKGRSILIASLPTFPYALHQPTQRR